MGMLDVRLWTGNAFWAVASYNGRTYKAVAYFDNQYDAVHYCDSHNDDAIKPGASVPVLVIIEMPKPTNERTDRRAA